MKILRQVAGALQMPRFTSAMDNARQQLRAPLVRLLAQHIYRYDKGNPALELSRLSEDCQAVYIAEALMVLTDLDENRLDRIKRIHAIDAHVFAQKDDERESVARQAREDVLRFGGRS